MLRLLFWVAVKDHNAVVVGHDRVELLVIVPIGRGQRQRAGRGIAKVVVVATACWMVNPIAARRGLAFERRELRN